MHNPDYRPTVQRTIHLPIMTSKIRIRVEDGLLEVRDRINRQYFRVMLSSWDRGVIEEGQMDLFPETIPVKRWAYPYGA